MDVHENQLEDLETPPLPKGTNERMVEFGGCQATEGGQENLGGIFPGSELRGVSPCTGNSGRDCPDRQILGRGCRGAGCRDTGGTGGSRHLQGGRGQGAKTPGARETLGLRLNFQQPSARSHPDGETQHRGVLVASTARRVAYQCNK